MPGYPFSLATVLLSPCCYHRAVITVLFSPCCRYQGEATGDGSDTVQFITGLPVDMIRATGGSIVEGCQQQEGV